MDQQKKVSPFPTDEQMSWVLLCFSHNLLGASDLSLEASFTQCFDCLPGSL